MTSRRANQRRGMTLLEVMLAMGLFAILSMFIFQVMTSVLGLWQSGERRGRGDLSFNAAIERLREDLAALHNGPRGWLVLDRWQPVEAEVGESPWWMPRLRFLARGASLPGDDPSGRKAVEVAWVMAPDPQDPSTAQWLRLAQIENPASSLQDDRILRGVISQGGGVPILDGVLWIDLLAQLPDGSTVREHQVPSETPFAFPQSIEVEVERLSRGSRRRPVELDQELDAVGRSLVMRGTPPLAIPPQVQVGSEWIGIQGTWPRLNCTERGARDGSPLSHPRGTVVRIPEVFIGHCTVSAGGRRVAP